jgi:membrane protease YdiL (CAAX protease family)
VIEPPAPAYLSETRWSITDAVWVLLGGYAFSFVAAVIVILLQGDDPGLFTEIVFIFGAQMAGHVVALAYLSRARGTGDWRRDYGFTVSTGDAWAIAAGFGLQIGVAILLSPIAQWIGPDAPEQQVVTITRDADDLPTRVALVIVIVLVAPVIEEIVFRGMLLSRLLRSMSRRMAVVASAAAFAAIHLLDPNAVLVVPGLFLIGLALGYMALSGGSLSRPILAHAGVNLTAAVLLFAG